MTDSSAILEELPSLRRYAWALLRDRVEADDLVQDCLERALSRWDLFGERQNLQQWLFTIMHNLHIDAVRKKGRSVTEISIDPEHPEMPVSPPNQIHRLEIRDLQRALSELPDEQKYVVLLIGLQGMSYEETSEVLGIPIGTVMSRLARAREQMRLKMEDVETRTLRIVK